MARPLILGLLLAASLSASAAARGAEADPRRESVGSGELRSGDLVALSRAVDVSGELRGTLVVIGGSVRVSGRVTGDVIAILAPVELSPSAQIEGDLLSLGAEVSTHPGVSPATRVRGRLLSVSALEAAYLAELRTSPLQPSAEPLLLTGFRLLLLAVWLAVSLALLFLFPRPLLRAAGSAFSHLTLAIGVGALSFVTAVLVSAFLVSALPARLSMPAVGLLLLLLLASKAFGLAALFVALGQKLLRRVPRSSPLQGPGAALAFGLLALGLASLVPFAGAVVWSAASLAGVGLALRALSDRGD